MINIDIEIKKSSRLKIILHRCYNKIEDITFYVIMKLPERFISHSFIKWMDKYTTKRISRLKQQIIKQTWQKMYLEKAVNEISNGQLDTKKAPSDD